MVFSVFTLYIKMKKSVSILGSTGSIGINTLKILEKKKNLFKYNIFIANKNYKLICNQIQNYKPRVFIINNFLVFKKVKEKFKNNKVKIFNHFDYEGRIFKKSDLTIAGIPGIAGLKPTIEFVKNSKKVLIANKESIICGWNLIKKNAQINNTKIIPIDSEHYSIMKLLENEKLANIKKIYLTASGGPFLNYNLKKLKYIKPIQAIKHPKWKMGKKISVDSATLMNKILELIEASKLFSVNINKLEIVIHPESLVHAIIQFKNGLHKFIYHETTMLIPIANAIFDKDIDINDFVKTNSKNKKFLFFNTLNFFKVDPKRYPVINIKNYLIKYKSSPIIINAANEILVDQYMRKKIPFNSFYSHLKRVLRDRNYKKYAIKKPNKISQIFQIDQWSRNMTYKLIRK